MKIRDKSKPLYKYYSTRRNEYSISDFNSSIIYFADPKSFNDPHDCLFRLMSEKTDFSRLEEEKLKRIIDEVQKKENNIFENPNLEGFIKEKLTSIRLSCLSEDGVHPLMWGHYADGLRGFCVEFSGAAAFLEPAAGVDYQPSLPRAEEVYREMLISSAKAQKEDEKEANIHMSKWMEMGFCTKLKEWEYEKEWRIGGYLKKTSYKKSDVLSVIVGDLMDDGSKKLIKDIIRFTYDDKVKLKVAIVTSQGITITDTE